MEKEYIKNIMREISDAVDELAESGVDVTHPKQVEISKNGITVIIPWRNHGRTR